MSDRRAALLDRFRGAALRRIERARALFAARGAGSGEAQDELAAVLGELHTIKGESRMLGLRPVAELVHAIEEAASGDRTTPGEALVGALDALAELVVSASPGEPHAEALAAALELLRARAPAGEPPRVAPVERSAPRATPRRAEWSEVRIASVDALCERLAELAGHFAQLDARVRAAAASDSALQWLVDALDPCRASIDDGVTRAWELLLVPVEPTLGELVRHARELLSTQGKQADVRVDAGGVELERPVLDALLEPLLHLVRNAIDHGLEAPGERAGKPALGALRISAHSEGRQVQLRIEDDGRGIDLERVRARAVRDGRVGAELADRLTEAALLELLFAPGFTTRERATELSGRGVGLDVVRRQVESVDGSVRVESRLGRGTAFVIEVPAAISRERFVVVREGGAHYGIPARAVLGVHALSSCTIRRIAGGRTLELDPERGDRDDASRGEALELHSLAASLRMGARAEGANEAFALVLESTGRRAALAVSEVVGQSDVLRRPADDLLRSTEIVAGSGQLADGSIALLLRPSVLLESTGVLPQALGTVSPGPRAERRRVLVVDDSPIVRDLISDLLAGAGFDVQTAEDGQDAWERLAESLPAVVVSDVEMPRVDGLELLRRVRGRWPHLPVVMVTTRGSIEHRRAAADLGASAYVTKSELAPGSLVETVRRFAG